MLQSALTLARSKGGKDETSIRSAFGILHDADSSVFLEFLDKTDLLSRKEMIFFWQSEYCVKHATALLNDARGAERLVAYFSRNEHANADFVRQVYEHNPNLLYRTARMCSIYDRDNHVKSLSFLSLKHDRWSRIFYRELSFLNVLFHQWLRDEVFYQGVLAQYTYSEILIHITSYYEKWKRSAPETMNNKSANADMEVTLLDVMNMMLTAKQKSHVTGKHSMMNEPELEECRKLLHAALPPLNPPEGIFRNVYMADEKTDDHKKLLRETIRFYFDYHQFYHYANMYSGGYADFEEIEGGIAALKTQQNWFDWRRNDFKHRQLKHLMYRKVIDRFSEHTLPPDCSPPEREVKIGVAIDEENWKFLALCPKLKNEKQQEVHANDCFLLLRVLSKVLQPPGRHISHNTTTGESSVSRQEFPKKWLEFAEPAYLAVFTEEDFVAKISSLLDWNEDKTNTVLSVLVTDLNSLTDAPVSIKGRPFLKAGKLIMWLSTFYAEREWYQLFLSSIQTDRNIRFQCQRNHEAETAIEKYFVNAGFNAKAEYRLNEPSGLVTAIPDVLAYRDNVLFILEYKLSYHDQDVSKAGRQQVKVFDYIAKTQIDSTHRWLKAHLDTGRGEELRNLLNIQCPFSDLTIVSMIVTNNFGHDGLLIDNRIRTITLYELSVVLSNNLHYNLHGPFEKMIGVYKGSPTDSTQKEDTMFSFDFMHGMTESNNPFRKENKHMKYSKTECDLWEGKTDCSAGRFLQVIDEELVWKFLDQSYRYGELISMSMTPFRRKDSEILF